MEKLQTPCWPRPGSTRLQVGSGAIPGVCRRSFSVKFQQISDEKTYENNFLLLLRIPPKLIPFCDIHMLWKICFKKKKEVYRYTCLGWRAKVGRHHTWLLISCTEPGLPKGHGSELLTPKQKLDSLTLANCGSIDIPTNQVLTLPTTPPGPWAIPSWSKGYWCYSAITMAPRFEICCLRRKCIMTIDLMDT